jgi:hypothetical protein
MAQENLDGVRRKAIGGAKRFLFALFFVAPYKEKDKPGRQRKKELKRKCEPNHA